MLIESIELIVMEAETMKNAYFFRSPVTASARRSYERIHSHDVIEWIEGENVYTAEYRVRCSCNNVYAEGVYTKDGKRTTLTAIKNSLKRLKEAR